MLELSVRLFAQDGHFTAQRFEQLPSQQTAGAMVRIEQDAESATANPLDIDGCHHGVEVDRRGIAQLASAAQTIVRDPIGPSLW